jgi:hypothetical protein
MLAERLRHDVSLHGASFSAAQAQQALFVPLKRMAVGKRGRYRPSRTPINPATRRCNSHPPGGHFERGPWPILSFRLRRSAGEIANDDEHQPATPRVFASSSIRPVVLEMSVAPGWWWPFHVPSLYAARPTVRSDRCAKCQPFRAAITATAAQTTTASAKE